MKDYHKGILLILLAVIASAVAFYEEDRRWEMAFINYAPERSDDIENLQAQILAGIDPTLITEPTAAGPKVTSPKVTNPIRPKCLTGRIARNHPQSMYHGDQYLAVKVQGDTYIELLAQNVRLVKTAFNVQSATLVDVFPDDVSVQFEIADDLKACSSIDMYLARVKLAK